MRISKQPSGGRGEYEIAENTSDGIKPTDLVGHVINLTIGSHQINTGVELRIQGGKRRLRRLANTYPQVQLQVASALMLPMPMRDEEKLEAGLPVLQDGRYIIKDIDLENVTLLSSNSVSANVASVVCANQAFQADQISVAARVAAIESFWQKRAEFPPDIAQLLAEHEALVKSGGPLPNTANTLVKRLQRQLAEHSVNLQLEYFPTLDCVPAMLELLGVEGTTLLVPLDQIEPEAVEIRRREIKKWRWAASRGASSVSFRNKVRDAYRLQCIMCGVRYPATTYNTKTGIDAAHILPWSQYDLDETYNGLALCKTHHWAFDEGILTIVWQNGVYRVEVPSPAETALSGTQFSLNELRKAVGAIPSERLPLALSDRPRPELLQRLNAELSLLR